MYIEIGVALPRKVGILHRFLIDHLENPDHHPLLMGCPTLAPKNIELSNIRRTTNPYDLCLRSPNCA